MKWEMTGTVYIVEEEKVLLLLHGKQRVWLPPGGHVEEGELPHQCAIREAYEETGLEVALIEDEHLWFEEGEARSLPRPYFCLLEDIKAHGNKEAHHHLDMVFVGRAVGGALRHNDAEAMAMRWFNVEEVEAMVVPEEIYPEVKEIIFMLLGRKEWRPPARKMAVEDLCSNMGVKACPCCTGA